MKPCHRIVPDGSSDDAGFTLVELLVVVVILGVIASALAAVFYVSTRNSTGIGDKLTRSHDAQIVANYIVSDAQGANPSSVVTGSLPSCLSAAAAPGSPIIYLGSTITSDTFTTSPLVISFVNHAGVVTRYICGGGTVTSNVVGHNIENVTARCTTTSSAGACNSTSKGMSVAVTETAGADAATTYSYTLQATFRPAYPANTTPNPVTDNLPLLSLGPVGISITGSSQIKLPTNAGIAANGPVTIQKTSGLTGVSEAVYSTGSCSGNGCPSETYENTGYLVDPYQGFAQPSGVTTRSATGCTSGHLPAGDYTNKVTIAADCVLDGGIYIFRNGLDIGQKSLTSAAGTGSVFYFAGGSLAMRGGGVLTINKLSDGSVYNDFAIYQPAANTTQMDMNGNTTITSTGGSTTGIVYLPGTAYNYNADITLKAAQLIVGSVDFNGNYTLTMT